LKIKEKGIIGIYTITGNSKEKSRCDSKKIIAGNLYNGIYLLKFIADNGKTATEKFILSR